MSDQTADTPSGSNENYQQRLLEKNVDLKRELSLAESATRKCVMCHLRVEETELRFCSNCGVKDGSVALDEKDDVIIKSVDKVRLALMCGSCSLDGAHRGHTTYQFQPFKHGSIAMKHLEKFQSSLKKGESALSNSVAELTRTLQGLEIDPADLEKRAKSVKTDEELDSLIGREREREKILNDAMDKFTGNVEKVVQKLKGLSPKSDAVSDVFSADATSLYGLVKTQVRQSCDAVLTVSMQMVDMPRYLLCNVKNISYSLCCRLTCLNLPPGFHSPYRVMWKPNHPYLRRLKPGESVEFMVQTPKWAMSHDFKEGGFKMDIEYFTGKTEREVMRRQTSEEMFCIQVPLVFEDPSQ